MRRLLNVNWSCVQFIVVFDSLCLRPSVWNACEANHILLVCYGDKSRGGGRLGSNYAQMCVSRGLELTYLCPDVCVED